MDVCRQIQLDRPPDEVWPLITDGRWLGRGDGLDGRPGSGAVIHTDDGRRHLAFDEVDPPRRLAFRWWPVGRPGDATAVSIELEPTAAGDGTTVTVTETAPAAPRGASLDAQARSLVLA